ncbi:hypothetical protein [Prosthecobacter sp.]|uniref:hypothetical protein n=1 Tax=Prosthecobacter sp. TaxID=1965333 RepID=UPI003783C466
MSDGNSDTDKPTRRRAVRRRWIIILGLFIAIASLRLTGFMISANAERKEAIRLEAKEIITNLREGISLYHVDYNRYPLPSSDISTSSGKDISIRSRGPMLPWLIGNENAPQTGAQLNPKDISYIRLPKARNRTSGTWQDGDEMVLSDPWGQPYYIVLDTSDDKQTANPEFGADLSDPDYAELCRAFPPPAILRLEILVYSSGPDRNPKTWEDNICSWRK